MIFAYNKEQVGDVLMVILQDTKDIKRDVERKGRVARVFDEAGKTLAWNIFDVSKLFAIGGAGQVFLSEEQVATLNAELAKEGFTEQLTANQGPVLVVGEILEMVDHPDSDHLHICQVEIGQDSPVQIVCGAPNAAKGLKTVAALPGAMMPDGSLIFPGKLRGEDSFGMLCSARELQLPNAPQVRGIIELSADAVAGQAFDADKHWTA
ncbi:YtpR family tRNA-binding protein [Streptococcus caprae]|uniref:YtpR family tRNA-binding protein n=1 Tax=Streptococcus caprae TaxID=1640501 RepID=A0ABV8CWK9_9STRE